MRSSRPEALAAALCVACLFLLSCTSSTAPKAVNSPVSTTALVPTKTAAPTMTTGSLTTAPQHYRAKLLLKGVGRPDDLVFDQQGRLLFSDPHNGTVSRLNADNTITVLLRGLSGPEGMVELRDGTLIIAEQQTQRILALKAGAAAPKVLGTLPGTPSGASCKDGVDGIGFDQVRNTLILPDSPTGAVYRMNPDGGKLSLLAQGITRPVGAAVDGQGNVYVADECGGAVWRISAGGQVRRIGGFGMPDDVTIDTHGNLLVIDLAPNIHALIRMNLVSGQRETLASQGFIEPQGLLIDEHDDIFVADDYANLIMEYVPA